MAKKSYTQAGARRALASMMVKWNKLHMDGYITNKQWLKIAEAMDREFKKLK